MGGRGAKYRAGKTVVSAAPSVPQSAKAVKDFTELKQYMQSQYKVDFDDSLANCDWSTVKAIGESVDRLAAEFPKFVLALKRFTPQRLAPKTYAGANMRGGISVNDLFYADRNKFDASYANTVKAGFHPAGTTADDVAVHEMGHVMEVALIYRNGRKWSEWAKCTQATRIVGNAAKALKRTPEGRDPITGKPYNIDALIAQVSRYARQNRSEAMAECVADYCRNGNKAKPLSKAVWAELKKELG